MDIKEALLAESKRARQVPMNLSDKDQFKACLALVYRLIIASEPLLVLASARSEGSLSEYFLDHLREERGHAGMLKADLLTLGFQEIPHSLPAASIAGSQYYLINHEDPAYLLGYMAVLEGSSMSLSDVDALGKLHGQDSVRTLRLHCEKDPGHFDELVKIIESLDAESRWRVLENASWVSRSLQAAFQTCLI